MNSESAPLYKNEAAGYWEAIYEGHHIVVPFRDFAEAVHSEAMKYLDAHPTENSATAHEGAHDAAWFGVIDASRWNSERWWHTDAPKEQTAPPRDHCGDTYHAACNCPPGFCLRNAIKEQQEQIKEYPYERESFTVYLAADGDEAALERMAAYFYDCYHRAKEGGIEEARYGSLYSQVLSAIARREVATHLETVTALMDALVETLAGAIGLVAEHFTTEKKGGTDAGTDSTETASQ